jgi:hypothetical protein
LSIYRCDKILVTFTGGYFDPGTIITYGFEDYYVNDYHVTINGQVYYITI